MKKKLRNGELIEEFVTASCHYVEDGVITSHYNDVDGGRYTGKFKFDSSRGKITRWYTRKSAPKWLLEIHNQLSKGSKNE